jgi:hypothetical protein
MKSSGDCSTTCLSFGSVRTSLLISVFLLNVIWMDSRRHLCCRYVWQEMRAAEDLRGKHNSSKDRRGDDADELHVDLRKRRLAGSN